MNSASLCSKCGASQKSSAASPKNPDLQVPLERLARLQDLIHTNEPPEGTEACFILSAITQTDARLAFLDKEISRLRDQQTKLEKDYASLSKYRALNCAILSPLRRMPAEVLGEIFSLSLLSAGDRWNRKKFQISDSPWIFTHVNRRWRAIAISTPSLWSQVVIAYHPGLNPTHLYPLSMVQTHIARTHKLKVYFYGCQKSDAGPQIEIFRCLAKHASRWEEASLRLTSSLVPLLAGLRNNIPLLRTLRIQWSGRKSQINATSIDCFETASALVDVGIRNINRFVDVLLPGRQLTTYELDAPWEIHSSLLKMAPYIVQAHIQLAFDVGLDWPVVEITDLLHLRRLFLSHTHVLNFIRAPALVEIALLGVESEPDCLNEFDSFLVRSGCSLRRLSLEGLPTPHITTDLLRRCPSIVELAITQDEDRDTMAAFNAANQVVILLTVTGVAPIFPQLSGIYFGCRDRNLDYHLFLRMAESRWKAKECSLKHVTLLTKFEGPNIPVLGRLQKLRQEGLDLVLSHGEKALTPTYDWFCALSY